MFKSGDKMKSIIKSGWKMKTTIVLLTIIAITIVALTFNSNVLASNSFNSDNKLKYVRSKFNQRSNLAPINANKIRRIIIVRARGFAINSDSEKSMRAGMLLAFRARLVNRTLILKLIRGALRINGAKYNVTKGYGIIGRFSRKRSIITGLIKMKLKAVDQNGLTYNLTLIGRAVFLRRGFGYIITSGIMNSDNVKYFLTLEGIIGRRLITK